MKRKVLSAAAALLLTLALAPVSAFAGGLPDMSGLSDAIEAYEDYLLDNPLMKRDPIKILPDIPLSEPQTQAPQPVTPAPVTPEEAKPEGKKTSKAAGGRMTSEGPMFSSFHMDLTDEPYMFTPVDLSNDGEYRFALIGDFAWVAGEVQVLVRSGMTIVTCFPREGVTVDDKNAFFTFFPDIRSVQTIDPAKLKDVRLSFGMPYAVPALLRTDAKVLLYVNCPVSYQKDRADLAPFSVQDPGYLDRMTALLPLMD